MRQIFSLVANAYLLSRENPLFSINSEKIMLLFCFLKERTTRVSYPANMHT
ncbi:hypothetical protein HN51_003785 [Arachis hypogaea]